jgi:hypothetical protein
MTDKAILILSEKFAIHTLGHVPTFVSPLSNVWNAVFSGLGT